MGKHKELKSYTAQTGVNKSEIKTEDERTKEKNKGEKENKLKIKNKERIKKEFVFGRDSSVVLCYVVSAVIC